MSDTINVPYYGNMQLGSLYNAYTGTVYPGLVFGEIKDPQVINWNQMDTRMKRINSSTDARNFLNVSARIALSARASGASASLGYSSSYLKSQSRSTRYVEVLEHIDHKTKTESVKPNVIPALKWNDFVHDRQRSAPTHYIRTIHYGGYLLASFRFMLTDNYEGESKTASFKGGASYMSVGGDVEAGLENTASQSEHISDYQLRYWTSVYTNGAVIAQDGKGLQKVVDGFSEGIKQSNGGAGIPLMVELVPLTNIYPDYPGKTTINRALDSYLDKLQALSDEIESIYAEAQKFLLDTASEPLAYNLLDDLQDFVAETYPLLKNVRNALDRIDFEATTIDKLFHEENPETNMLIHNGIDTKQCEEILNFTYRCRFVDLRSVILKMMHIQKPMVQITMEYSKEIHTFLVTVLQAAYLPSKGLERNPDPYVVINLTGQPSLHQERRTETVSDNCNPVFNASSVLPFKVESEDLRKLSLRLEVFDKDVIGDDQLLAATEIPLLNVRISTGQTRRDGVWVALNTID